MKSSSSFRVLKIVMAGISILALTQAWALDCDLLPLNATTGVEATLDWDLKRQEHGKEPRIADLNVAPHGMVPVPVGSVKTFHVRAVDSHGQRVVDTEAAIYTGSLNPSVFEHVWTCTDANTGHWTDGCQVPQEPARLTPAYHTFVNDGQLWLRFEARSVGTTKIWISYPGLPPGWLSCSPGDENCTEPNPATHVVWIDVVVCPSEGCPEADADGDGVPDHADICPLTPPNTPVHPDGCPVNDTPVDSDGDGVPDADDDCPGTPPNTPVDAHGCTDTDEDGTADDDDPCPTDPTDACPTADTDGDGVPNGTDNCPSAANHDQADADQDGTGDVCDSWPLLGWSAQHWHLRGQDGQRFSYTCEALPSDGGDFYGTIYGTDVYTDDSYVCVAAVHAGKIPRTGGRITVEVRPGQDSYIESTRNGVRSHAWGPYHGSFIFVP